MRVIKPACSKWTRSAAAWRESASIVTTGSSGGGLRAVRALLNLDSATKLSILNARCAPATWASKAKIRPCKTDTWCRGNPASALAFRTSANAVSSGARRSANQVSTSFQSLLGGENRGPRAAAAGAGVPQRVVFKKLCADAGYSGPVLRDG